MKSPTAVQKKHPKKMETPTELADTVRAVLLSRDPDITKFYAFESLEYLEERCILAESYLALVHELFKKEMDKRKKKK
jgi:hypothetical protein